MLESLISLIVLTLIYLLGASSPDHQAPLTPHLYRNAPKDPANGKHGPGHSVGSFQLNSVFRLGSS